MLFREDILVTSQGFGPDPVAGAKALRGHQYVLAEQHAVGDEDVVQLYGIGARGLHAQGHAGAPVGQHIHRVLGRDEVDQPGRLAVLGGDAAAADEVGRIGDARGIGPAARDPVAALHPRPVAARRRPVGRAEIAVRAEDFGLHRLGEMGAHHQGVGRGEGEAPGRARMAAPDLHHHAQEVHEAGLVAAEHLRLQHPVEAGLAEGLVHGGHIVAEGIGLVLLGAQHGDQRMRPLDHRFGRQPGLGLGQVDLTLGRSFCELDIGHGPLLH